MLQRFLDEGDFDEIQPEEPDNRRFYMTVGVLGAVTLGTLICILIFSIVIVPINQRLRRTEVARIETQNAIVERSQTPAPTETRAPTATPTGTPTPSPSPGAVETDLPTATPSVTPTPQRTPTPTRTAEPTGVPEVIYEENFTGSGGGWVNSKGETFELGYFGGGYRLYAGSFFSDIWSVRDFDTSRVRIVVEASKTGGPADSYYGVICRFQDGGNYYALVISEAGEFRIFKKVGGIATDLGEPGTSSVIRGGGASNEIQAQCDQDSLSLAVNGESLLRVEDDTFEGGSLGLLAGTRELPGLEVIFDNLELSVP